MVRIERVTFEGAAGLPRPDQAQITNCLEETRLQSNSDWLAASRQAVREALERYGYVDAMVDAHVRVINRNPNEERLAVAFQAEEGQQFRLAGIKFTGAHVFPVRKLRAQFPLADGDVFNVDRIREGLKSLLRLYGTHGYLNFATTDDLRFDTSRRRITAVFMLEEGKQFRVGGVEVLGAARAKANHALKVPLKTGEVFNSSLVDDFYKENRSVLPAGLSPLKDTKIIQDTRNSTVTVVYDVRRHPNQPN